MGRRFGPTREVLDAYHEGLHEGGHDESGCETLGYFSVYVGETPERARADANDAWERHRRISDDQRGSPERFPLDLRHRRGHRPGRSSGTRRCAVGTSSASRTS